ncbi:LytTR family transcriptional regulator [Sphingomonas sp. JC676]|uniref:LytTR family DNA-binding domain-containing protein n=1 Tax=Sphingomonas sp. JC676 TaxID=2768065 RepID=UPI0016578F9E|nr:LytTR family DNA-binding domain-containing protein [Sphingomonas sp. JC676]MBC9032428.1 LytTR family transcriptional regulator [Sphingomonas sp. JC676]
MRYRPHMASRPFESISGLRISGTGAGVLALLAFLLGYGVRGGDDPSATRPIPGDEAGIPFAFVWGVLITLGWAFRDQLRAAMLGPQRQRLLLVALAFVPVMVADALATQLAAATAVAHPMCPDQIAAASPFAGFLPRSAILGGTMLLVLLAWERHLLGQAPRLQPAPLPHFREQRAPSGDWLDLPEAPLLRIRADDVVLIRSAGNYSEIVALGRAHLVRAPLGTLADRLAALGFVRVHRQTIINARNVRQICRDTAGRALIHLDCGQTVPVGRRYLAAIDALTR